jgi:hypothetical protein
LTGAHMVSTLIQGQSHWFVYYETPAGNLHVDLTGDQFGLPPVQYGATIYPVWKNRYLYEIDSKTFERYKILRRRFL